MQFPSPFTPDPQHRAGRMMLAGRVKVTMEYQTQAQETRHITLAFKCFADNRKREYDAEKNKNWVECTLADATHVFVEVPRPDGGWADKVGTFYPKTGRWYHADGADADRVNAACLVATFLSGRMEALEGAHFNYVPVTTFTFQEAEECGVCGRELTDPESIARGVGPICFGRMTSSQHQVKGEEYSPIVLSSVEAMATTEDKYGHGTNPAAPQKEEHDLEELLGIEMPTAAVNSVYWSIDAMCLDQLVDLDEHLQDLITKRREAIRMLSQSVETKNTDKEALGR